MPWNAASCSRIPPHRHRLAELLRRVVVAVLAVRPGGRREHQYAGDRQREAAPHASSPCSWPLPRRPSRHPPRARAAASSPRRRRARVSLTAACAAFDTRPRIAAATSAGSRVTCRNVKRRTRTPAAARIASRSRSRSNARRVRWNRPAVDLDDEPAARPVEVDLEAADDRVHARSGDAVRVAEREERVLELAPRDAGFPRCTREQRREERRSRPARWAATTASSAARSNSSRTSACSSARSTVRRGNVAARSRRRPRERRDRHAARGRALLRQQCRAAGGRGCPDGRRGFV